MQPFILTQAQAEAVYSAMCALNNVGGCIDCRIGYIRVNESAIAGILIMARGKRTERHDNQAAFAAAYGLNGTDTFNHQSTDTTE